MSIELGEWVRTVIAFDTNAYRTIAHGASPEEAVGRAERLVRAERACGIQAMASPVVLLELLAHLGDPTDPSHEVCKSAVCAAVRHCRMPIDDNAYHVAIRPSTDLQLCISLWDIWPEPLLKNDDMIRAIALRVSEDPSDAALDYIRPDLMMVREELQKTEAAFAEGTNAYLMPAIEASAKELGLDVDTTELRKASLEYLDTAKARELVAEAHVLRAMDHTSIEETAEGLAEKAKLVADGFEVGIRLYVHLMKKILVSHWDLTKGKGANLLWDMQVAFLIGKHQALQGRPLLVVSGDRAIVDAAVDAGVGDAVLSYEAYRTRVA